MAERTVPIEKKYFRAPENGKPFVISSETAAATAGIISSIEKNGAISQKDAEHLADSIVSDARVNGTQITNEEQQEWKKSVIPTLTQDVSKPVESLAINEKLDLKEYANALSNISKVYDLPHTLGNVAAMESVMIANKVGLASMATGPFLALKNVFNRADLWDKVKQVGMKYLQQEQLGAEDKTMIKKFFVEVGWPLYVPIIASIPLSIADGQVRKHFVSRLGNVREAINHRIGESIFMRDFEFIHDKSSAEIMSIVFQGKESTIDLLEKTYLTVIPTVAKTASGILPQVTTNPMGAALAALRVGTSYVSGERLTKNILQKRGDLMRKQEVVDTRIMTSLSGLDVIKTSDSIQESIGDLEKNMKTRDDLAKDMGKMAVMRDKRQETVEAVLGLGIPFMTGAWDVIKAFDGVKNIREIPPFFRNLDYADPKFVKRGVGVLKGAMNVYQSLGSQGNMDAGLNILANTYARDIKPALQDIKRMEDLLGPYDQVDRPNGSKEKARKAVGALSNFDIKVTNLQFKNILHSVSMDVPQGSFVTIKGPSGIGKTTFFQHLVGLYGASEGAVRYGGVDLQRIKKFGTESIYSKIAYANQNPQYFEDLSLRENLLMWSKTKVTDDKIKGVLHDLRLDHIVDRMDSKVKHFSGGELRRIGIARALLKDPKVLFLDEPTANLDQESAKQVLEIIKDMRVKRPDMTVVAVTHDADFEKIAEKIVDFREINTPKVGDTTLGDRQVFYADAKGK